MSAYHGMEAYKILMDPRCETPFYTRVLDSHTLYCTRDGNSLNPHAQDAINTNAIVHFVTKINDTNAATSSSEINHTLHTRHCTTL